MGLCTPYVDSAEGRKSICTSATRPTGVNVWPGKEIYETDTTRSWIYVGGAWVFTGWGSSAGRPGVILTDAAQTITTGTPTDVTWSAEVQDVDGWTSGASATLTVPAGWGGRVALLYSGIWQTAVSGSCGCALYVNGAVAAANTSDVIFSGPSLSVIRTLSVADTLKIRVQHGSGANRDVVSRLELHWLGP